MISECLHYREEESRRLVKSLQRQLIEVKKEKEIEIQVGLNDNNKWFECEEMKVPFFSFAAWQMEMWAHCFFLLLQQRNEMIAHLKDQLQEMKAKTSMEGKYIKKDAEVCLFCASFCS